jgi:ubiquinol-cytochrome c reductase iron-sulfur subunit
VRPARWFLAIVVLARTAAGLARGETRERRERIVPAGDPDPRAEALVIALLLATALAAAFFVVAYGVGWSTQVLGGAMGGALALLAAALIVAAKRLVVSEELAEEYPEEDPEQQEAVTQIIRESGGRITRKRLLGGAAGLAGGALGIALIAPAVSLGPVFDTSRLNETPWRRGRRLVDEQDRPLTADQIERGAFYTAFPEGADHDDIASPLVLIRLAPEEIRLPPGRAGWAPEGILAYSKICTHAGCAIALYRNPLYQPVEPDHALVCPCHYSTFDAAAAGKVLFGPAGRPLPQLPLMIDATRQLRAAGNLSGPAGPGWWGVRSRPTST